MLGLKTYKYTELATSMQPSIAPGDMCLCCMKINTEKIKRGTIVLLRHDHYDYLLTKRVIARENELIEIEDQNTYIDKILINEPYAFFAGDSTIPNAAAICDSVMVENGKLFVMGDNRNNSLDSRNPKFGLVDLDAIAGRPLLILWSTDRKKILKKLK